MELILACIGVGMILQLLEGVTSGSEEVDGLLSLITISVDRNFLVTGTWATPTMDTWGDTTIVAEVEAGVIIGNDLEEKEVHAC